MKLLFELRDELGQVFAGGVEVANLEFQLWNGRDSGLDVLGQLTNFALNFLASISDLLQKLLCLGKLFLHLFQVIGGFIKAIVFFYIHSFFGVLQKEMYENEFFKHTPDNKKRTYRQSHTPFFDGLSSTRHGSGSIDKLSIKGHDSPTTVVFISPASSRLQVWGDKRVTNSKEECWGKRRLLVLQKVHEPGSFFWGHDRTVVGALGQLV